MADLYTYILIASIPLLIIGLSKVVFDLLFMFIRKLLSFTIHKFLNRNYISRSEEQIANYFDKNWLIEKAKSSSGVFALFKTTICTHNFYMNLIDTNLIDSGTKQLHTNQITRINVNYNIQILPHIKKAILYT